MKVTERELEKVLGTIGRNIQRLRKVAGLTQVELEELAGVYDVGAVERGEKNPTVLTLCRIAKAFEVGVSDIVEGSPRLARSNQTRLALLGLLEDESRETQRRALKVIRAMLGKE